MVIKQKLGQKTFTSMGSFFSQIAYKRQKKMTSTIHESIEDIELLMGKLSSYYNIKLSKEVTERDLIYYLYLNPIGYIDDSNKDILQSPIAEQYFSMGILTNGVGEGLKSQYRLTAYGSKQINNALDLEMLK